MLFLISVSNAHRMQPTFNNETKFLQTIAHFSQSTRKCIWKNCYYTLPNSRDENGTYKNVFKVLRTLQNIVNKLYVSILPFDS